MEWWIVLHFSLLRQFVAVLTTLAITSNSRPDLYTSHGMGFSRNNPDAADFLDCWVFVIPTVGLLGLFTSLLLLKIGVENEGGKEMMGILSPAEKRWAILWRRSKVREQVDIGVDINPEQKVPNSPA